MAYTKQQNSFFPHADFISKYQNANMKNVISTNEKKAFKQSGLKQTH